MKKLTGRQRLLLIASLFIAAFAVFWWGVFPAFSEIEAHWKELKQAKFENQSLLRKLANEKQAEEQKLSLENQIRSLRGAVPKTAELDLFVLDLEEMCKACHLDLVAVEDPEGEVLRELKAAEEAVNEPTPSPQKTKAAKPNPAPRVPSKVNVALKSLTKQVFITGSYSSMIELMRKLEDYQRIIGISHLAVALPTGQDDERDPASERATRLKLNKPMMSFVTSVYYLP